MAGRYIKPIKDKGGRTLVAHIGNHTVRVGEDKTNKRYVLFNNKSVILRRKHLDDITHEFDKLVNKDNLITIPPEDLKHSEYNTIRFHKRYSIQDEKITVYEIPEKEEKELTELHKRYPNNKILKKYLYIKRDITSKKYELPAEVIIKSFMSMLKKDKYKTASIAKMPILAKLDEIDPSIFKNNITITLEDVLAAYKNRVKDPPSQKSKKEAQDWLKEFSTITRLKSGKTPKLITDIAFGRLRFCYKGTLEQHSCNQKT